MNESDTTQAIRDALAAMTEGHPKPGTGWEAWDRACAPSRITALLAELDAARAGIEAAVLAERERCAVLCELIGSLDTVTNAGGVALRWGAKRIREGVKS